MDRIERLLERVQRHSRMPEHVGMRPDIVRYVMIRHFLYEQLAPLLAAALTDSTITAWVGATDPIALMAQAFLEQHRRKHGGRSVIGFDNSLLAFANGLSSYDFNIPSLINHLMTHILGPRTRETRVVRGQVTEVAGFVMARASTDTAPR
jgi:DNA-binding LacI/PurR family transcriptional regulator